MSDNYAKLLLRFGDPGFLGALPLHVMGMRFDNVEFHCEIRNATRLLDRYITMFFVNLHSIKLNL